MNATAALVLSVLMIASAGLLLGGIATLRRGLGQDRRRGWLMIVAALVLAGNVAILTV
ncbi:hypothetical protein [Sphingomonas changnyeongensis]|jgi:hypothetical protein|uniref:hypothetical protein n=1 Tax=Sphingomonas changnyeongensis TaxID=2698679 RepID=UPI00191C01CE|nr:hypothetical protein [Sphingomonas changnyeongensis]